MKAARKKEEESGERLVPNGVSVFDLIMPWKSEIKTQIDKTGLSKVINCSTKAPVEKLDLAKHAQDVQAILINPPWNGGISITDFKSLQIPTNVMKDGLLFVWIEKSIMIEIIKHLES